VREAKHNYLQCRILSDLKAFKSKLYHPPNHFPTFAFSHGIQFDFMHINFGEIIFEFQSLSIMMGKVEAKAAEASAGARKVNMRTRSRRKGESRRKANGNLWKLSKLTPLISFSLQCLTCP
jgi:hypothetical protein